MSKFTPGPWVVDDECNVCAGNRVLAVIEPRPLDVDTFDWDRAEADCSLIAAAPDLYEALSDLIGWIPNADALSRMGFHTDTPMKAHAKARAALAKARGEA